MDKGISVCNCFPHTDIQSMYTFFHPSLIYHSIRVYPTTPCAALCLSKVLFHICPLCFQLFTQKFKYSFPPPPVPWIRCSKFPPPPKYQAFSFSSSPQSSTAIPVPPWPFAIISRTSAALYFLVTTFFTDSPLFSLSSSCALIQHLAIRFRAISTPPGRPALTLPPNHHGFSTRSKECSRAVKGRAAAETKCEEAYGRMSE